MNFLVRPLCIALVQYLSSLDGEGWVDTCVCVGVCVSDGEGWVDTCVCVGVGLFQCRYVCNRVIPNTYK